MLPCLAYGAGQVRTSDIVDGAVTNPKITSMDAAKLTGTVPSGTLTGYAKYADVTADFLGKLRVGTGLPGFATAAGSFYSTGTAEFGGTVYFTAITGNKILYIDTNGLLGTLTLGSGLTYSAGTLSPDGANITSLSAANISSGTLSLVRGGTGQTSAPAAMDALSPLTTNGDLIVRLSGTNARLGVGTSGQVLTVDSGTGLPVWATPGTGGGSGIGTVTSVAMTVPAWLSVAGSPITSSGTLAVTATTGQTANQVLATPNGSTGAVGLRALVAADIPVLPVGNLTATAQDDIAVGGGSAVYTRLAKGSDSQVLTVDPTTHHLVWATPSGASAGPGGAGALTRTAVTTATYTILSTDYWLDITRAGSVTLTLPSAPALGTEYIVTDSQGTASSNTFQINSSGSDFIDSGAATSILLTSPYESIYFRYSANNRWVASCAPGSMNGMLIYGTSGKQALTVTSTNGSPLSVSDAGDGSALGAGDALLVARSGTSTRTGNALHVNDNSTGSTGTLARFDRSGVAEFTIAQNGDTLAAGYVWSARPGGYTSATANVTGDFSVAGWGTSPTLAIGGGSTDAAGSIVVTAGATGVPTNPATLTLTFKDGAWKNNGGTNTAPFCMVIQDDNPGGTPGAIGIMSQHSTTTTLVIQYNALPVVTDAYKFTWMCRGQR